MPDKSSIINWANEFAQIIYHKNRATLKSMLLFNKQTLNKCLIKSRRMSDSNGRTAFNIRSAVFRTAGLNHSPNPPKYILILKSLKSLMSN